MTTPERAADDPLLRVLGKHFEQQEAGLNVDSLHARILANCYSGTCSDNVVESMRSASEPERRWPAWIVGVGSVAIAASLLLAFLVMPSSELRAEQAIRQAEEALRLPVERCYLVEVRPDGDNLAEEVLLTRTMRVWAAEDKFRVEMTRGNLRWSWGRDADGVIWLTANPQRGVRIAPEEQGRGIVWMAELYKLRPETLLSHILAHCRFREDPRPVSNYPRVIHAEPRAGARQVWLRSATLELDAETKVVRKLKLKRANKADGGTTTVTFTLIDTRPVEHARYELEGNLVDPFQIYDHDFEPTRRREILARWVGPHVDAWLKPVPKKSP
jgi:hypothetical protein